MTCPIIPDFIFKLFEQEITKINMIVVDTICKQFNLDKSEVVKVLHKELNMNVNIIGEELEHIKIVKKHSTNKGHQQQNETERKEVNNEGTSHANEDVKPLKVTDEMICEARVYIPTELLVKQCSRSKIEGQQFCKLHNRLFEEGKLKYGTIRDEKPDAISTSALNLKVKRKIY